MARSWLRRSLAVEVAILLIVLLFALPLVWLAAPVLVYIVPLALLGYAMHALAGSIHARR